MSAALRAGVTGGVMGTIALTTAAAPSSASGKQAPAETVEMPALSDNLATSATHAADSMESAALHYELQDAQEAAAEKAREKAAETKKAAVAEARAEARKKAEEAREKARAAEARADRDTERTDLGDAVSDALPSTGGNASGVLQFAKEQVGKAYVMGSTGPSSYDCSGLTGAAYRQAGVDLPRTSQEQSTTGTPVGLDSLKAGDLVYWGEAGEAYHIGIYMGDGKYIGAQNPSTGVVERDLDYDPPTGAVRVL